MESSRRNSEVIYVLYPIFLKNCFLSRLYAFASTTFDLNPSTIPSIALPCCMCNSTSIISIELAVAQNMLTSSGTSFRLQIV
jgi:hypothetical protein